MLLYTHEFLCVIQYINKLGFSSQITLLRHQKTAEIPEIAEKVAIAPLTSPFKNGRTPAACARSETEGKQCFGE